MEVSPNWPSPRKYISGECCSCMIKKYKYKYRSTGTEILLSFSIQVYWTCCFKITAGSNFNISFTDNDWFSFIRIPKWFLMEIRTTFIQFTIINQFYWTPSKLFRLNLGANPKEEGTLSHSLSESSLIRVLVSNSRLVCVDCRCEISIIVQFICVR